MFEFKLKFMFFGGSTTTALSQVDNESIRSQLLYFHFILIYVSIQILNFCPIFPIILAPSLKLALATLIGVKQKSYRQ